MCMLQGQSADQSVPAWKAGGALQERRGSMKPETRIEAPLGLASCPAGDGPTFG